MKNKNNSKKLGGGMVRFLAVLLITAVIAVAGIAACRYFKMPSLPPPNYDDVRLCMKSLVESQSSYCVHKTRGRFAADMNELGFVRERGDVMLERVWKANWKRSDRVANEGYFFTTFSLENGKRAIVLGIPANKKPPYFIALYGEIGASMMKARGTSVYRSFDSGIFTDDFIAGKTTLERVREIIEQSERVPENL